MTRLAGVAPLGPTQLRKVNCKGFHLRALNHLAAAHFATALLALVALLALPLTWPAYLAHENISDLAAPASIVAVMAGLYFLMTAIMELRLAVTGRSPDVRRHHWLPAALVAHVLVAAVCLLAILRGVGSLALLAHLGPVLAAVMTVSTITSIGLIATTLAMRGSANYGENSAKAATSAILSVLQIAACVLVVASLVYVESRPVPNAAVPTSKPVRHHSSGESGTAAVRP